MAIGKQKIYRSRWVQLGSICHTCARNVLPFHVAAWVACSEPIQRLLNEEDETEKDRLTATSRDTTQSQLSTICITSALFGGVIATSYTWPALSTADHSSRSTVTAVWYSALVLALTSIAASAQQAVALSRLSSHPEGLRKIREVLGKEVDGLWKPRKLQLIVWQTPITLVNFSIVMFAVGLGVLVWSEIKREWSWNSIKIVSIFTVTLCYSSILYVVTAYGLYHRIRQT